MPGEQSNKKSPVENFGAMFEAFGKAMGEILNAPELKDQAKELGNSIAQSAEAFASRLQDEDVKLRFREAGKAAQEFGESVADYFKADKEQK